MAVRAIINFSIALDKIATIDLPVAYQSTNAQNNYENEFYTLNHNWLLALSILACNIVDCVRIKHVFLSFLNLGLSFYMAALRN